MLSQWRHPFWRLRTLKLDALRHTHVIGQIGGFSSFGSATVSIALTLSATALEPLPIIGEALSLVRPFVVAFVAGVMIVVALKEVLHRPPGRDPHGARGLGITREANM